MRFVLAIAVLLVAPLAAGQPASAQSSGYIVKESSLSVAKAVEKIEAAIEVAPPTLMAKIDHGENARKAGMEIGESVLLIFGAPKVGTPIMDANPLAGLDLPVKILVWNREDRTMIGYLDPMELGRRHGVSDAASEQLTMMTKVLDRIASAGVE
ncbi:DUF302 domain-containing protein [Tepidamorphus sp. 3E244]|uniref:DUF302 domain-containing protein n=1 Tax=Tepidamorphus sp. 3E244 TaxID=3385498 RepID=UPI0038FC8858